MRYTFELKLITDGDFGFSYIPVDMGVNYEDYYLEKDFETKEDAFKYIQETIEFLKKYVQGNQYAIEDFKLMVDSFYKSIENDPDKSDYHNYMYGNYDGTVIKLNRTMNSIKLNLYVNDEEYELYKNTKYLTYMDIKNAILDKCKEIKEKYQNDK